MSEYSILIFFACIYTVYASNPVCGVDFDRAIFDNTNEYRRKHGASAVALDPELVNSAQGYANELCRSKKFVHSNKSKRKPNTGENLYRKWMSKSEPPAGDLGTCYTFYREVRCYRGKYNKRDNIGHFTQLVWKSTTHMGCGCCSYTDPTDHRRFTYVVVCHYSPAGNIISNGGEKYKTNVGEPWGYDRRISKKIEKPNEGCIKKRKY